MKARDIIRGWPRGRSTSGYPLRDAGMFMTRSRKTIEDEIYHENQQSMVDNYRALMAAKLMYSTYPHNVAVPQK